MVLTVDPPLWASYDKNYITDKIINRSRSDVPSDVSQWFNLDLYVPYALARTSASDVFLSRLFILHVLLTKSHES
jgi:hypothetical protein